MLTWQTPLALRCCWQNWPADFSDIIVAFTRRTPLSDRLISSSHKPCDRSINTNSASDRIHTHRHIEYTRRVQKPRWYARCTRRAHESVPVLLIYTRRARTLFYNNEESDARQVSLLERPASVHFNEVMQAGSDRCGLWTYWHARSPGEHMLEMHALTFKNDAN